MPTYRLFSGNPQSLDHYVAKLNVDQFDMNEFQPPIKLYRGLPPAPPAPVVPAADGTAAAEGGSQAAETGATTGTDSKKPSVDEKAIAPFGNALKQKRSLFKKKTRLYTATPGDYEEQRRLRRREALPWIFEDEVGDMGFVGRLEGDISPNYVLFIYENGGFTVIPVKRWYKFNQRITYRTLTTDEAEEHMKSKSVKMDRWVMRRMQTTDDATVGQKQVKPGFRSTSQTAATKKNMKADVDEMLFDDVFDDDEEYGQAVGEDQVELDDETERRIKGQLQGEEDDEEEQTGKRKSRTVGQDPTKKLLKKMKQEYREDSDDEDKDPYAMSDGEDLSDSDESEEEKTPDAEKPAAAPSMEGIMFGGAIPSSQSLVSSRASSPSLLIPRSKKIGSTIKLGKTSVKPKRPADESRSSRESSPAQSVSSDHEPAAKKIKTSDEDLIKQEEVIALFRQKPQWETQEIISVFKKRLKRNQQNQSVLREILQRVTTKVGPGVFRLRT